MRRCRRGARVSWSPVAIWRSQRCFSGKSGGPEPSLGDVAGVFRRHAELLVDYFGSEDRACRDLRKHVAWYFKGYSVGGELRARLSTVQSLRQLDDLLGVLDHNQSHPGEGARGPRGRAGAPRSPSLPDGWLDSRDLATDDARALAGAEINASGG